MRFHGIKMRYSIEPRDGEKLLDSAKKSTTDATKTAFKKQPKQLVI